MKCILGVGFDHGAMYKLEGRDLFGRFKGKWHKVVDSAERQRTAVAFLQHHSDCTVERLQHHLGVELNLYGVSGRFCERMIDGFALMGKRVVASGLGVRRRTSKIGKQFIDRDRLCVEHDDGTMPAHTASTLKKRVKRSKSCAACHHVLHLRPL